MATDWGTTVAGEILQVALMEEEAVCGFAQCHATGKKRGRK